MCSSYLFIRSSCNACSLIKCCTPSIVGWKWANRDSLKRNVAFCKMLSISSDDTECLVDLLQGKELNECDLSFGKELKYVDVVSMVGLIGLARVHQLGCSMDAAGGRDAVGGIGAVGTRDEVGVGCPKNEMRYFCLRWPVCLENKLNSRQL